VVFQHRKKQKVLNSGVSASGKMMKGCWQQCFSNGKNSEKLLVMMFQQQKGKGETIAGRSCFVNENGEEMANWCVLGVGRIKSAEQWCFSIGKNDEGLLATVFQQWEK
jgi:hypothetical protein